jgi:hypothetical protein
MLLVTRKIELAVLGEQEEKNTGWQFLRKLDREVWRAANQIISDQWFYETFEDKVVNPDQARLSLLDEQINQAYDTRRTAPEKEQKQIDKQIEGLKRDRNKLLTEAKKEAKTKLKALFEVSRNQLSYRMIASKYSDWGSNVYDALSGKVNQDFANDYFGVLTGQRTLRRYKKGMPIPVRASGLRFVKEGDYINIQWIKGIRFRIVFGRDRSSRKAELERILTGEYTYGDSSIQVKENKLFLLLALKHPEKPTALDVNNKAHVQAGIRIPVRCVFVGTEEYAKFGDAGEVLRKRVQFQNRRRRLQQALKNSTGGKGRGGSGKTGKGSTLPANASTPDKANLRIGESVDVNIIGFEEKGGGRNHKAGKLQALGRLAEAERNYMRTENHRISKQVIKFCLKHNIGTILLEEMKELPKDEEEAKFYERNWSGHDLKVMIQQKAKAENITVELLPVKIS